MMRINFRTMAKHVVTTWTILKQSVDDFMTNKSFKMSAALAYYTIFSLAPMLIVIITACDIFYGREAIQGAIFEQIQGFVGADAALQIEQIIRNAAISKDISWASIIGAAALLFAATGVFAEIQDSINFIWRLKAKPKKGWLKMILNRLLSFSMVVSLGFIMLVSLIVNSMLDLIGTQLTRLLPDAAVYIAYAINLLITFATISCLFAIIFKVLPDARIQWRDVWIGSFTTAFLFMLGKFGISFYLGRAHIGTTYGAAGSVVIVLLWVYYSAAILYFGACYTRANAMQKGRNIYPNDYAVWIQEIELENKASLQAQDKPVLTNTAISVEVPKGEESH
jgi:membrane protein